MAKAEPEPARPTEFRDTPIPKSNNRKRGAQPNPVTENSHTFFQSLGNVHKDDWGTRYNLYIYRQEPIIDRTRAGEPKYIMQYAEPISEDRILADHGSGRYKLILNFRKPGADRGDEVDTGYISLLNMNYPPRIAPGEWVDDPRNRTWSWAKKTFPPEAPNPAMLATDPLKALEAVNRIRKDISEEMRPNDTAEERMLMMATILEKLSPRASSADEMMKNIAVLMHELRPPEDKLNAFLLQNYGEMLKEVLKSKEQQPERANGLAVIKEVVTGFKDLIPQVKELIPGLGEGTGAAVGRSRLNSWQEFTVAMGPYLSAVLAPLAQVVASRIQNAPMMPPGASYQLPAPAQGNGAGAGAAAPGTMMPFLQMIANPMVNYAREMAPPDSYDPQECGEDFAAWVHEGFGANPLYNDAIAAARLMGPIGVIAAFKATPLWNDRGPTNSAPSLASLETQLFPFFNAFLNWTPPRPEQIEEDDNEPLVVRTASEAPAA